ncbi:MAG: transposase [Armatimonadetes bacterium]|nr:transposase [Armatimonadota bacterium]
MNLERPTRRHLKPDERRRVAERCESSGLAGSEFARRHGIPLSSLRRWVRELRNTPKESPAVVFHEVAVCPPWTGSASPWAVEIVGRDGVTVRCRERLPVEELARLLRGGAC